jgi:hypothetical protein
MNSCNGTTTEARGYAPVNDLKMYYEIEGTGDPLVCIPPAFGYAGVNPYPALVQSHTVITVDLQGMVARPISRSVRFRSSNTPKMWLAC